MSTAGTYYDETLKMNGHLITAASPGSASFVRFTSIPFDDTLVFHWDVLLTTTNHMYAYFSGDNFATSANINWYAMLICYSHTAGGVWSGYVNQQGVMCPHLNTAGGTNLTGRFVFGNKASQGQPQAYWHSASPYAANGNISCFLGSGFFNVTTVNAIQFNPSAGTFNGGSIRMYRLTK